MLKNSINNVFDFQQRKMLGLYGMWLLITYISLNPPKEDQKKIAEKMSKIKLKDV